jgi:hypothetical protein
MPQFHYSFIKLFRIKLGVALGVETKPAVLMGKDKKLWEVI